MPVHDGSVVLTTFVTVAALVGCFSIHSVFRSNSLFPVTDRESRNMSESTTVQVTEQKTSLEVTGNGQVEEDEEFGIEPLNGFVLEKTSPIKWRPFKKKSSLEPCSISHLILLDSNYDSRISLRASILTSHPSTVLGTEASVVPAIDELYRFLFRDYLPSRYPNLFRFSPSGTLVCNYKTINSYPIEPPPHRNDFGKHALVTISKNIEDDIFILLPDAKDNGKLKLRGFVCCFPCGFDPSKKLGMGIEEMHAAAPRYGNEVQGGVESFLKSLPSVEKGAAVRFNWRVSGSSQLFMPTGDYRYDGERIKEEVVDPVKCHLRVERQLMFRLPNTNAIVFMTKTYLTPLSEIKAEGDGEALAAAIESMSADMAAYKKREMWGDRVVQYLRQ
ncbi:hypothetical protein RUND412_002332 [Rhizina undulata]